jgi:hypothetical protein
MAQPLSSYTVLDTSYQNGSLQYIAGLEDSAGGSTPSIGTVNDPAASAVSIETTVPDPVIFSFPYTGGGVTVRALLGKIVSKGGVPASSCNYSVLQSTAANLPWTPVSATMGQNIIFQDSLGNPVATNPHGLVWVGNFLYIIDYESQKIYRMGKTDLDALANGNTYTPYAFNLSGVLDNENAKGQAIIALQNGGANYLFALYLVNNSSGSAYEESILVRLNVDSSTGNITYAGSNNQVTLGLNSQAIIPVTNSAGTVTLLIPEIGGSQGGGTSNGTRSDIYAVPAFAATLAANKLVTGDPSASPLTAYDIHAIAASTEARDGATVYILTADYTSSYSGANWKLYKTTVSGILGSAGKTLSNAGFTVADQDNSAAGTSGYFWDILLENAPSEDAARLWFLRGSPILAALANYYGSPTVTGNPYAYFTAGSGSGTINGENVNSFDLTAETLRQAQRGVSLKRGFRLSAATRAAIKSAKAQEEQ